ncbi:Uncharacterised protein [Clostridium fallax]|uniref:DUF3784 domain-containing protein n=1 Tax=Clostridium fallax TaxID=1533 RepID=A0A1M4YU37_9CLOT|nr:hypothetical protein SAMN05443638_1328 [Clostridium fallax]SQB22182.1 Uncharacterised protein [Clostridium fallax]
MIIKNIFSICFTIIGIITLLYSLKNRSTIHLICKSDFIISNEKALIKIQNITSYLISSFIITLGLLDSLFKIKVYFLSIIIIFIYFIGLLAAQKCIIKKC